MASSTPFDDVHELGHLVVNGAALFHLIADLFDRMNDRGVIPAAEFAGDGGIAEIGALAHDIHGDLAGRDEWTAPIWPTQLVDGESEDLGRGVENGLGRDLLRRVADEQVV